MDDIYYSDYEKTLGVIKTKLLPKIPQIEKMIRQEGLVILQKKRFHLLPIQAEEFYSESKYDFKQIDPENDKMDDLNPLFDSLTTGPIDVLIIAGFNAVTRWLDLIGPTKPDQRQFGTIRNQFGARDSDPENGVHGSLDYTAAQREIRFFYPQMTFQTDVSLGSAGEYLTKTVYPILVWGLLKLCDEKPECPLIWLGNWLLENKPQE